MSYQPFSRADRNRWRRGERPRAALWMSEWWSARFEAWLRRNPSRSWQCLPAKVAKVAAWRGPLTAYRIGAP